MKNWIKKKLGIVNHAEEMKKIGEWMSEGLKQGLTINEPGTIERIGNCPSCQGTGEIAFGPGINKYRECIYCEGTGMDKSDMSTMSRDNHTVIDPLLENVTHVIWEQQEKVLRSGKYEHPIHKDNHTAVEWMDHQMSELADALVYHECLIQTIKDVHELIDYAYHKSVDPEVDELLIQARDRLRKG